MAVNSRNQPATAPQSKKRVAPGDGGRAQKKRNIDKKDTKAVGKSAPPVPDSRDNKAHRKKPVTAPVEDSDETADEDGDELDDGGRDGFEGGDEMLQEGDDAEAEDTGMEVDNPNGRSGENPALKSEFSFSKENFSPLMRKQPPVNRIKRKRHFNKKERPTSSTRLSS